MGLSTLHFYSTCLIKPSCGYNGVRWRHTHTHKYKSAHIQTQQNTHTHKVTAYACMNELTHAQAKQNRTHTHIHKLANTLVIKDALITKYTHKAH